MRTETKTLIEAARVLARDIQSDDGVANAAMAEIADRLEELETQLRTTRANAFEEAADYAGSNGSLLTAKQLRAKADRIRKGEEK